MEFNQLSTKKELNQFYGFNCVSQVNSLAIRFQPLDIDSGAAASQLDSTQPFDARAADDFCLQLQQHLQDL